jgi:putative PEP-CTERM system histidine kinase
VGTDWGRALQIELVFAALLLFVLVASSGRFRSKLKVFVSKHFFSYRYDYREEWLKFTGTLAADSALQGVHERAVMALANLVESPAGMLWLKDESGVFRPVARWNLPALDASEPESGSLVAFMARSGWVIDLKELASDPPKYSGAVAPAWMVALPHAWLIIPLAVDATLLGFVVLDTPRASVEVDWEVRDMLKTASRQAASYLEQMRATEALVEARKFDAFNRMSAFVVHDLKNLVAQLSLMLRNAERHRGNPEFERDMLSTVEHVVERMNKLMLQLRTGAKPLENLRPVDLAHVVKRVCAEKSSHHAVLEVVVTPGISTFGHEDRLEHVIAHLVQNAIDATVGGGSIVVRLYRNENYAIVEIADTGVGMTPEFIRERLFRPFETTKATGTGIGVYESKQYVSGLGGQLLINSTPQAGTCVQVMLPLGDSAAASSAPLKEVA